ncbi:MAG: cytochrome c oxidase subunit II [Haloarculaceae archaeon]
MEIHRFEKIWLGVSLLFIVGLIASIVYGVAVAGTTTVGDTHQRIDPSDLGNTSFANPGGHWDGSDHYVVHVVGQQWSWKPGSQRPIYVPANTSVTFYLTSADVVHGFEVVGTDLNVMLVPGQVTKFTTTFDHPTTYGVVCNEYCGASHQNMEGQLVVVPPSALSGTGANATGNASGNATGATQQAMHAPQSDRTASPVDQPAGPTGGEAA